MSLERTLCPVSMHLNCPFPSSLKVGDLSRLAPSFFWFSSVVAMPILQPRAKQPKKRLLRNVEPVLWEMPWTSWMGWKLLCGSSGSMCVRGMELGEVAGVGFFSFSNFVLHFYRIITTVCEKLVSICFLSFSSFRYSVHCICLKNREPNNISQTYINMEKYIKRGNITIHKLTLMRKKRKYSNKTYINRKKNYLRKFLQKNSLFELFTLHFKSKACP